MQDSVSSRRGTPAQFIDGDYNRPNPAYAQHWADVEAQAFAEFRRFLNENSDTLKAVARQGDGMCGALTLIMREILLGDPSQWQSGDGFRAYRKQVIPAALRIAVFERDAYRCVTCSGWRDLCCDHRIPESKGGETTLENLQTMCRSCNSKKGTSVEIGS